ncbi:hypothetical protein VP3_002 [Vibrio phage VP3]|uniref:Uncharacterized protein n=1 Tax=Vibrio phage VP3 TaxID=588068 RepID=H9YAF0_9CAUD|nr:hypothetical protein VP3_002 [Vibrio phage VP3]
MTERLSSVNVNGTNYRDKLSVIFLCNLNRYPRNISGIGSNHYRDSYYLANQ